MNRSDLINHLVENSFSSSDNSIYEKQLTNVTLKYDFTNSDYFAYQIILNGNILDSTNIAYEGSSVATGFDAGPNDIYGIPVNDSSGFVICMVDEDYVEIQG